MGADRAHMDPFLNILQAMLHRNFTLKIYPRNLHQIHVG
jgi:hypothetical protein